MDASRIAELPGLLRTLADDVAALPDFSELPKVVNLRVGWDQAADTLKLTAQYAYGYGSGDDLDVIADLNTWAAALGGGLLLGDEVETPEYYWRSLSAVAALPGGFLVEVWTHLHYQIPTGAINAAAKLLTAA
jgi:hypothetical protein